MAVPEEHLYFQPTLTRHYDEPKRHWKTVGGQTSDEIVQHRRRAEEPLPMGPTTAVQQGLAFDDQAAMAGAIDRLRSDVHEWRDSGCPGTSNATRELLEYWVREPGEGPVFSLFYAQREAIETVVFLAERGNGTHWMVRRLKEVGEGWNWGLTRIALRKATGTGKTIVMACLVARYVVNRRREHRGDSRGLAKNVDRIVVVCPGRTIRDRLAGLNPRAKRNIYDEWLLLPPRLRRRLGGFPVDVINWENLQTRKDLTFSELEVKAGKGVLSRTKVIELVGDDDARGDPESLEGMGSRILGPGRAGRPERVVVPNETKAGPRHAIAMFRIRPSLATARALASVAPRASFGRRTFACGGCAWRLDDRGRQGGAEAN